MEDLMIHKLIAGRPRDLEDIKSILIKNPDYDAAYLAKWLPQFDAGLNADFSGTLAAILKELKD